MIRADGNLRSAPFRIPLFTLLCLLSVFPAAPAQNRRTAPAAAGFARADIPRQGHAAPPFFTINPGKRPLVDRYIAYYRSEEGRSYLAGVLDRGKPFRDHIAAAIDEAGMPPELLYLPVVESAFREDAVSRSGAAGLWQFMMNSIGPYPITVDSWRDERRDFWKSTDAALHKLAFNYSRTGDWLLAVAAYNCGLGRVERTIASSGITDFWELSEKRLLPQETIHYVPRFLAAAAVASHPGRNGLSTEWDDPLYWKRIPLEGQLAIPLLSAKTGVDRKLLERGNAELFHGVTPPVSDYALKVPLKTADTVERALRSGEQGELMKYTVHSIGPGDTLYALAAHFGVTVPVILISNPGLVPERLRIGSRVVIPVIGNPGPYRSGAAAATEEELERFTGEHTVASGETLWAIARKYGTSPEAIAQRNNLAMTDTIYPGHRLKVPPAASGGGKERTESDKE